MIDLPLISINYNHHIITINLKPIDLPLIIIIILSLLSYYYFPSIIGKISRGRAAAPPAAGPPATHGWDPCRTTASPVGRCRGGDWTNRGKPQKMEVETYGSWKIWDINMGMDQYLLIPFLGGWTSIYQLFWCELQGTRFWHTAIWKKWWKNWDWTIELGYQQLNGGFN
jgi:hypothetical protein